ncbi:MAG: DUF4392 domain-containing protein [Synergistaceae bacterium]|jgi:hypothetical protein|nr:DUF4392 domain-containing protein [Synergistaceae bacterium]
MLEQARARRLTEIAAGGDSARGPSALCEDGLWNSALDLVYGVSSIAIVSGFYIPIASAPETDGPTGSVTLARALLRRRFDIEVWTDFRCIEAFRVCAESISFPLDRVIDVSGDMDSVKPPEALVYVERPGRASDGAYYDMMKQDISSFTCALDAFAMSGVSRTIGIGDGGNEVGMGNYMSRLSEMMPDYAGCLCTVKADVTIPVDVSNWGAYALAAAISIDAGEWLAQTESEEIAMLEALRAAGAVDGVTKKPSVSVDGFDISKHLKVRADLQDLL